MNFTAPGVKDFFSSSVMSMKMTAADFADGEDLGGSLVRKW